MSGSRVEIISGKTPIIIVSPHGYMADDENTAIIAKKIAKNIDAYAVINWGFERADAPDHFNDKADCNNIEHCHAAVIKEEFLDPIIRFGNKILQNHDSVYIYYIHGMANRHRISAGDSTLDAVIGFGAGSPNSFSCELWQKNLFIHLLKLHGLTVYEGKKGGSMSGWARSNMNQLFRKWYPDDRINSMQIELIYDLRKTTESCLLTAHCLSDAMSKMLEATEYVSGVNHKAY